MSGLSFTLILIFGVLIWIYAMARMGVRRSDRACNQEDTETIQELHRGLQKMARRVESLETILLDQNELYRRTPPPMPRRETADR
jgi:phage shock protein B